jgi:hypothetical protein
MIGEYENQDKHHPDYVGTDEDPRRLTLLSGHPNPANGGHLKTGQ